MSESTTSLDLQRTFERELRRDVAWRQFFNWGTLGVSLLTVATLLVLIMPMGRTSPFLFLMSLYSIATRLLVLVAKNAFLFPRFVLRLEDDAPAVAAAALAVFERHRVAIATPVLQARMKGTDAVEIAKFTPDFALGLARAYNVAERRGLGVLALVAWGVVSLVGWGILIATGGGPTN